MSSAVETRRGGIGIAPAADRARGRGFTILCGFAAVIVFTSEINAAWGRRGCDNAVAVV